MLWSLLRKYPVCVGGGGPQKFGSESRFKLERPVKEAPCLVEVLGYVTAGPFSFYMPIATRELFFFHGSV